MNFEAAIVSICATDAVFACVTMFYILVKDRRVMGGTGTIKLDERQKAWAKICQGRGFSHE